MALCKWQFIHPKVTIEWLGLLPMWLNDDDKRGAAEQLDSNYPFGGFSRYPMKGFEHYQLTPPGDTREYCLKYPGDPLLKPLAKTTLRDETICFYDAAIVAVFQKDGSFVASRFD